MENSDGGCLLCGEQGCTKHPQKEKRARKFLAKQFRALAEAMAKLPTERLAATFAAIRATAELLKEEAPFKPEEIIGVEIALTKKGKVVVHRFGWQFQPTKELIDPEVLSAFARTWALANEIRVGIHQIERLVAETKRLGEDADDQAQDLAGRVCRCHCFLGDRILRALRQGQTSGIKDPDEATQLMADQQKIDTLRRQASDKLAEAERLETRLEGERKALASNYQATLAALESKHPRLFQLRQEEKVRITFDGSGSCQFFELCEIDEIAEVATRAGIIPQVVDVAIGDQSLRQHSAAELATMIAEAAKNAP